MRSGRLRRRLLLQQQTESKGAMGGTVQSWSTTATVWGAVEGLYGFEGQTADQTTGQLQVKIIIRYDSSWSAIDTSWRVKDKDSGKCYDISSVIPPEQRSSNRGDIELMCFESDRDDE